MKSDLTAMVLYMWIYTSKFYEIIQLPKKKKKIDEIVYSIGEHHFRFKSVNKLLK